MRRTKAAIVLSMTLMANSTQAQQSRTQPVCRPGFLRGELGCVRAREPASATFATEDSSDHYSVVLETRSGSLQCPDVSHLQSCVLRLEPEGELRVRIEGDASFSSTIAVPRGGTMFRIERRGYGLLIAGLTVTALGGGAVGLGIAGGELETVVFVSLPGALAFFIGLPLVLVDLFRYHSRITTLPLSGPTAQDRVSALPIHNLDSGFAMVPVLSTPILQF